MSFSAVVAWFLDPANWHGYAGIPTRVLEHLYLSGVSMLIAMALALPVGILLGHYGVLGNLAVNVSNVGRAVPTFALLVIRFQLFHLGDKPVIIALVALAIPPMVTNSFVALRGVDPDVRDAARGMGYRDLAQLLRVELPLALPLVMAGIRTSAVQVVATATLGAVIAGGGLGRYILDGLGRQDYVEVFAGAFLVALLAIVTELSLAGAEALLRPPGLRRPRVTAAAARAA